MYRLIDRGKTPPQGFLWIDPITTQAAEARNYANWVARGAEIRSANGNPIPSEAEMEDQLCRRYDEKTRQHYCQSYDGDQPQQNLGVGSTLKTMLAAIGVNACWGCINLAKRMDDWGPDGCEEHMAEILEIMEDNAKKKNWLKFLPFKQLGSRIMVQIAIDKVREQSA